MECPTKLFYTGKDEYVNNKLGNPFLEALAEGGFQVGELAKTYYPGGYDIDSLDYEIALKETEALMSQENCTIFEAAIKHDHFFVRVDILIKEGNNIKLIEVKSKSADQRIKDLSAGKEGVKLNAEWRPYVQDIAFQYYVAEQAFPEYTITPYLMLVDKDALCPTDGLNQKFKIAKDETGRAYTTLVKELTEEDLSEKLLVELNTEIICRKVIDEYTYSFQGEQVTFAELVQHYAKFYEADERIEPVISSECKHCEFKASDNEREQGLKCGYRECFKRVLQWKEEDFVEDTIFDLWDFRRTKGMISNNKIKLSDLKKEDVGVQPNADDSSVLSRTERQWKQVKAAVNNDPTYYIDKENLKKEMESWTFPLHFIDFETTRPVIPFNKGKRPNEMIAFQFSHHIVYEDGTIEHKSEFLNTEVGVNPNVHFVRALKNSLENDDGTIFRYHNHENTVLNEIYDQLQADASPVADKEELCEFIQEITQRGSKEHRIKGQRNMVDLYELVIKYYYDPAMKGSNSIKVVLPAILNSSQYLQEKYAQPIYGAEKGIKSLNFKNETWVTYENGKVKDPYKLLPKLFDDISDQDYEHLHLHEELNDGGAAMTAYERLQYENIPSHVRKKVEKGLLKYCELDTLAMVFIYEAWVDMIKEA